MRTVARISTSPVQGFALGHPDHVELTPHGVADNRRLDTGERDLDVLRLITSYRGVRDGEAIDFGVYGTVEQPGRVRVGAAVEPLS